jgi:hypothetical protein
MEEDKAEIINKQENKSSKKLKPVFVRTREQAVNQSNTDASSIRFLPLRDKN